MTIKAGGMTSRIRIDDALDDIDGMIAPRPEWVPIWECNADISTLTSRQYFSANREGAANGVQIVMRYPPVNVTTKCRAVDLDRGITYAITGVLFDTKRTRMTLDCTSGVNDG